ncbi:MAG: phage tail fiber protein [Burkholderiaceae bacterium]
MALAPSTSNAQAFTDYTENKIIDWLLRAQSFAAPATTYVSLHTATCTDAGGGTEASGGNYSRQAVTSSLANWAGTQSAGSTSASSGTGGVTSNNNAISWGTVTWSGTVTHWAIWDAATSGNMLFCAALTSSQTVSSGNTVQFAAAALTITLQ